MKYFPLMSCLFFVLLFGCNEVSPKGEKEVREFVNQSVFNTMHSHGNQGDVIQHGQPLCFYALYHGIALFWLNI